MESLRIAHVDAETGFSGGEVQVFLLMEGLAKRGHESVLLCPPGSRAEGEARTRGIPTRAVRMASDLDLGAVPVLKRELEALKPDLVHLHTARATWLGGLAAKLARIPAITTRRMDKPLRRGWRQRLVYGSLVARAVAISPAVEAALREGGVPAEKLSTISSSVDPKAFDPAAGMRLRKAHETGDGAVVVLALASLVRRKGLDVLLEAVARIRDLDLVLWIAGDGPERATLEAQTDRLGLAPRVRFLGRRDDAPDLVAACDVFVLPSRREGLGVAALEAMAAGKPVVASRVGGLGETVLDGLTGLLVEPEDARGLARAIEQVARDPELRQRLGAAGRARISEAYLPEQMVAAYEKLYREVLAGRERPA
jgi:glycosyltransferase involved in cell wall biosynthesis